MPLQADQKATVHVVDDDASMRGALQDLIPIDRTRNADIRHRTGFYRRGRRRDVRAASSSTSACRI